MAELSEFDLFLTLVVSLTADIETAPIAIGASFDERLWRRVGAAIGAESRALHNAGVDRAGLVCWRPRTPSYKLPATSYQLQATSYKLQVTSYKSQASSYKSQATSHKLQAASYRCAGARS